MSSQFIMTDARKETPLCLLSRSNLAKYLTERRKLCDKSSSESPDALRGRVACLLHSDQTFGVALSLMRNVRVQSMPLVRYKNPALKPGPYDALCFLSVGDLVTTMIEHVDRANVNTNEDSMFATMNRLATVGVELESLPLSQCRTRWDGTVIWSATAKTQNMAESLEKNFYITDQERPGDIRLRSMPHRFAVLDDSNNIEFIVSQSDIAMYLYTNRDVITDFWTEATVSELGLAQTPGVVSVACSTMLIEAFRLMEQHRIGALPVVDEPTGAIVGVISESDITHFIAGASFAAMALPVGEMLLHFKSIRTCAPLTIPRTGVFNPQSSPYAVTLMQHAAEFLVVCKPSDTLTHVLSLMDDNAVHRIFVVDEASRPTGVISLADILVTVKRMGMSCKDSKEARERMMIA
jgi:CBS domain-containing protein